MAQSPLGGFADLGYYQRALERQTIKNENTSPLDSAIQGFNQGQAIQNLPDTLAQNQLADQVKQALLQAQLRDSTQGKIIEVNGSLVRVDPNTGQTTTLFTSPSRVPSQFVGTSMGADGTPQAILFNPQNGTINATPLPTGVSSISPKVTQPAKAGKSTYSAGEMAKLHDRAIEQDLNPGDYTDAVELRKTVHSLEKAQGILPANKLPFLKAQQREFDQDPAVKNYGKVQEQIRTIDAALKTGDLGLIDQAVTDSFISDISGKSPTAQQYQTSQKYGPAIARIENFLSQLTTGGASTMTPERRQDFIDAVKFTGDALKKDANVIGEEYKSSLKSQGIPLKHFHSHGIFGPEEANNIATPGINPNAPSPVKIGRFTLIPQ